MIVFFSEGRIGNQIFQYSFLKTISKKNETIICLNMQTFFETFDFDKQGILHNSNKYIGFIFKKIILPLFLKPLSKAKLINYIEQKKDSKLRPLPEWNEQKGLLPFIRYVNTDFFQSETFFDRTRNIRLTNKRKIHGRSQTICFQYSKKV